MAGEREIQEAYNAILANDFERAIGWFDQAIALEPDNASYHYKLSITCARSNRLPQALEHARIAMELEPDKDIHRFHLYHLQAKELLDKAGKCFGEDREHLDSAVRLLLKAISLDPLSVEAYLLLALAYSGLGEGEQALQSAMEALRLDPLNEPGRRLLEELKAKSPVTIFTDEDVFNS